MKGPGERLRQLLNIYNADNSVEYEDEQFERRSSIERKITSQLNPVSISGPLATSARKPGVSNPPRDNEEMELPESPNSTSTLQANGHRLPRPHVSKGRNYRKESIEYSSQLLQDGHYNVRQSAVDTPHRTVEQTRHHQGMSYKMFMTYVIIEPRLIIHYIHIIKL